MADEHHPDEATSETPEGGRSLGLVPLIFAVVVVVVVGFGVFAFLDNSRVEIAAADTTAAGGSSETTAPADGGGGDGGGDPAAGEAIYQATCSACHAPDAGGVDGLGPSLASSEFVQSMSDEELVAFITVGRDTGNPENTTGVAMPPRGGNPALSDEDLLDIVAWLRTLQ